MSDKELPKIVPMDDDVTWFDADETRLRTFDEASEALSRFKVPPLVDPINPHEKLFIAAFDGTGNDKFNDPEHATNISRLDDQIKLLSENDKQVYIRYLEGPGTQASALERTADLALGHTYEARLEEMYGDLVNKAKEWREVDPNVQIRVFSTGFSRGGSQAAGFTNLLHERGIIDRDSRTADAAGQIAYTRHIAAPGQTPQAVGLFDPVATGLPETYDRRLAPSVVSGFQITALDEQRVKFVSDRIMPMGLSEDGRFLNVTVAGAHSDVGGSYLRDGLARRSFNLMSDYLNAQRPDAPMLEKVFEPTDPRLNVVHNSHEGMTIYQLDRKVSRSAPEGVNTRLAPDPVGQPGQVVTHEALPHGPKPGTPQSLERPAAAIRIGSAPSSASEPDLVGFQRIAAAEAAGMRPLTGAEKLARNLSHGAAAATAAYEVADTAHDYNRLRAQGNLTAAQAAVGRTASTATGAWLGFEAGAALGAPLGPGALATGAVGAVAGGVAGDKLADAVEQHRIYTQRGSDGNTWQADPAHPEQGWTRDIPPLPDIPQGQHLKAPPALADELNYKAVARATELGLASASARDPFTLPASKTDTFSAYGGDWTRNPDSGRWQRQINADKPGLGMPQSADPARAAELDAQSRQVTADNAAHSPAAVAATFKALYTQNDWQRHGKLPEAVDETLAHPNRVVGSDGRQYAHEPSGQWTHDGLLWDSHAQGNLRNELNLAVDAQQQQVQRILQPVPSPLQDVPTLETVRVTAPAPEQGKPAPSEHAVAPSAAAQAPPARHAPPVAAIPERLNDPSHPAHAEFKRTLQALHYAEARANLPSGPHSEQVAAALMTAAEQQHLRIDTVQIDGKGQALGIQQGGAFEAPITVQVDPARAVAASMEAHTAQWSAARSPHLRANAPASERSAEQAQGLAAMSAADQAMFGRIRQDTPAHIHDDHVALSMLNAKRNDIHDISKINKVGMGGDLLWVMGTTEGFRAATNVAQPAPPMQDTLQQVHSVNQQREQQLAMDMQPKQDGPGGRGGPAMG